MQNIDEHTITDAVIQSFDGCGDERLKFVLTKLVEHLHEFSREVRLTEEEWFKAIQFLTETGHITDEKRQEFILLSDTLGLTMLVTALNHNKPAQCTEASVLGPFYVEGAPELENGADIGQGAEGEPCWVDCRVLDTEGQPIAGATVDIWETDLNGYDVQQDIDGPLARGRLKTLPDGRFNFWAVLPVAYTVPHDGPVGRMLAATDRHPWRPGHLHFLIDAPGYERLVTQLFRGDDEYLESDAVFGVRSTLVADWVRHEAGTAPDGTACDQPFYTLAYDFVLNRE